MIVDDRAEKEKLRSMSEVERLRWALEAAGVLADLSPLLGCRAAEISQGLQNLDDARIEYNRRILVLHELNLKERR